MTERCFMNSQEASRRMRSGSSWWDPSLGGWRLKDGRAVVIDDFLPNEGVFDEDSPEGQQSADRMMRFKARERSFREFMEIVS